MERARRARVTRPARRSIIGNRFPKAPRKRSPLSLPTTRSPHPASRVLVVDDDPDARLLLGTMIEAYCDAEVTLCATVDEAIASAGRVLPDLVVTDAMMPGQDGFDLIRRLRQVPRAARVPVVVATASREPQLHARLLAAGACAILAKPPAPEALADIVFARLAAGGGTRQEKGP